MWCPSVERGDNYPRLLVVLIVSSLLQVCPWTLFLTMSLTLLKGLMPHVPQMLPFLITDPEMRSRAEETFLSPEFQENIEEYFVNNIKVR